MKPLSQNRTQVTLLHEYGAIDDDLDSVSWIEQAVNNNSNKELGKLKQLGETVDRIDELLLSFEDSVEIAAEPEAVYDFLYEAAKWRQRIPHVSRLDLQEEADGIQYMDMDTQTTDGSVHTTSSIRICLPPDRIVYKQIVTPALMTAHTGGWHVTKGPGGTVATARHTVLLDPDGVQDVLGPEATVATARDFIRNALGKNSTVTLEHAKAHAEVVAPQGATER